MCQNNAMALWHFEGGIRADGHWKVPKCHTFFWHFGEKEREISDNGGCPAETYCDNAIITQ